MLTGPSFHVAYQPREQDGRPFYLPILPHLNSRPQSGGTNLSEIKVELVFQIMEFGSTINFMFSFLDPLSFLLYHVLLC